MPPWPSSRTIRYLPSTSGSGVALVIATSPRVGRCRSVTEGGSSRTLCSQERTIRKRASSRQRVRDYHLFRPLVRRAHSTFAKRGDLPLDLLKGILPLAGGRDAEADGLDAVDLLQAGHEVFQFGQQIRFGTFPQPEQANLAGEDPPPELLEELTGVTNMDSLHRSRDVGLLVDLGHQVQGHVVRLQS